MLSPQPAASKDLVSPPSFPPRGGPRSADCRAAQQGGGGRGRNTAGVGQIREKRRQYQPGGLRWRTRGEHNRRRRKEGKEEAA